MIKTPAKRAEQHQLFLDLQEEDGEDSIFIQRCLMLDKKFVINCRDSRDEYGYLTLLHESAMNNKICALKYLLSIGHEIDPIDSSVNRVTPLMEAVKSNNVQITAVLIKNGANLTLQDIRGDNVLHYAARVGTRIIRAIISNCDMSKDMIQSIVCTTNVKLKFPEDLAINESSKEYILYLRENGVLPPYKSKSKSNL